MTRRIWGLFYPYLRNLAVSYPGKGKEELSGQTLEIIELRDEKAKPGEPQKGVFWVGQDGFILKYELYDSDNNLVFLQSHDNIQPEVSLAPAFLSYELILF